MNRIRTKLRGSISLLTLSALVATGLAGAYAYIDNKADTRAQQTLAKLVDEASEEGVALSYSDVDASPLLRSVSISDFAIKGSEQEPDLSLGDINISGFNWQDLHSENTQLPASMTITIDNGTVALKPSMVKENPDIQSVIDTFGEQINFSTHFAYVLNQQTGVLTLSTTETVVDNFSFNSELAFGGATWLAELDAESGEKPGTADMMSTTLNELSMTFKNDGFIEKIRSIAATKTGQSPQQLTDESVQQLNDMKVVAEQNWGPVLVPMIDELIKFTLKPEQLHFAINPEQGLKSNDFLMAFMGGDAGLLALITQAQIEIKAN